MCPCTRKLSEFNGAVAVAVRSHFAGTPAAAHSTTTVLRGQGHRRQKMGFKSSQDSSEIIRAFGLDFVN